MSAKVEKQKIDELKRMIEEKDPDESAEKVLAVFCQRHGISMVTCRYYYKQLVEKGEIKE